MFTGIIDHKGEIIALNKRDDAMTLTISTRFNSLELGESIAVDGICLTVTEFADGMFCCDLSPETLRVTRAKYYEVGSTVNLERSLSLGDRLGGHLVMGHTDANAEVIKRQEMGEFLDLRFKLSDATDASLLARKGSVAVNGVSMTVNSAEDDIFSIMLIPHTASLTNLSELQVGSRVNIEYDTIARYVANHIKR